MDALNVVFEFSFLPPPLGNVEGRNSIRLRSAWNSAAAQFLFCKSSEHQVEGWGMGSMLR